VADAEVARPGFVWQFPAVVDRVQDGDTLVAHVLWHAGNEGHGIDVRLEGINALELSQQYGAEARDRLAALAPPGTPVTLLHRKREKYGRFMARVVRLSDGLDVCLAMVLSKASDGATPLAIPYNP
jgi:endonuclease YncB( thermonuclease family)